MSELEERDFELRRQIMGRAIERVWSVELGETAPLGGFTLERPGESSTSAADVPPERLTSARPGSAADLARRYRAGEVSPVEIAGRAIEQAQAEQGRLNAFITILGDSAVADARASEERFRRGTPLGPLDGVPVAIKDLIHIAGVRTTSASKIMEDFVASEDAPVIRRLRAAGAVLVGKTNLHEFAYGGTGDVSYFGPCRNPVNPEHIPGGSSSGSGAAVAAGICPIALGSDTGGSIRIPAALCGIVGLKATYGSVPTEGAIPLSWSQDHIGPLTATVEDAALAMTVLGHMPMPNLAAGSGRRWTLGICRELFFQHLHAEVRRVVEQAIARLGDSREVHIPHLQQGSAAQTVLTACEAGAFHHNWLEARGDDYDWRIRNRIQAGRDASARDLLQAVRLRRLLVDEMGAALEGVDLLAVPTVAVPAPRIGQRDIELEDGTADATALMVRNTAPMNFTGFPAISIPCGASADGLPIGLQLVALPWQEERLLQAAYAFEQVLG